MSDRITLADALADPQILVRVSPCPFCGGDAEMVESVDEAAWYTVCLQCSCQIGPYSSRLDMIPAWNRRVPNVVALERIAELEAQLAEARCKP